METSAEKLLQSYWEADINASLETTKEIIAGQQALFWVFLRDYLGMSVCVPC